MNEQEMREHVKRVLHDFDERKAAVAFGPQFREMEVTVEDADEGENRVTVSFSSERPVERWWGVEILRHTKDAINFERAERGLPVLDSHWRQIGIADNIRLKAKKLWGDVAFGSGQEAQDTMRDVINRIKRFTSAGYRNELLRELKPRKMPGEMEADPERGDFVMGWGGPVPAGEKRPRRWFEAFRWAPFEFSFVGVPADIDVGRGARSAGFWDLAGVRMEWLESRAEGAGDATADPAESEREDDEMKRGTAVVKMDHEERGGGGGGGSPSPPELSPEERKKIEDQATEREGKRIADIEALAERFPHQKELCRKAITERWDLHRTNQEILAHMPTPEAAAAVADEGRQDPKIGMTDKEIREYSISEAILRWMDGTFKGTKYEEASNAQRARFPSAKAKTDRFAVPWDVVAAPIRGYDALREQRADLTGTLAGVHGSGTGGGAIGQTHRPDLFIDLLRTQAQVVAMGATVLDGLVGNVTIPKLTAAASYGWIDADDYSGSDESSMTIGSVTGVIKTVRARQDIRRHLLMQGTPAVDAMVSRELALRLGIAVDAGALVTDGTAFDPTGILNQGSIGDVSHGPNGGEPSWATTVALWSDVAQSDAAFGALGYLTSPKVAGKLMTVGRKATGDTSSFGFVWDNNSVMGYPARHSTNVPDNLTKGAGTNLSAAIFGNWNDLIIFLWGMLEVKPDPYTLGDSDGLILRAFQSADVAVRHPESFSAAQDIDAS